MTSHVTQDIRLLYEAVYDQDLREKAYEYNVYAQFETWIDNLISEGYDLSEYTWDDMYDYYISEAKSDEGLSRDEKEQVRAERQGGRDRFTRRMRTDVLRGKKREKGVKSSYDSLGNLTRTKYRQQQFKRTGNPLYQDEEFDLYDIILSHLLDEGYAETPEEATVIMSNMSEEWREEILDEMLDEANRAEQELGLSSRERERARNLQGNLSKPIFYQNRNSQLANRSDSGMNRMHRRLRNKRRQGHEERRNQG
jgi:hypothetical protein